jgi:uncharacterized protein YggU (UPF0235/DUF167 family)
MFWRVIGDAVAVAVKVHPRARRPGLHGIVPGEEGERLAISVSEAAEDHRASRAACAALVAAVGVAGSHVEVTAGTASRRKTLRISGDAAAISGRLAAR